MGKTVSGDVGGATAGIRVPVGGDRFDVPADMERMANDVIAAIRAKPVPVPPPATQDPGPGHPHHTVRRIEFAILNFGTIGAGKTVTRVWTHNFGTTNYYCFAAPQDDNGVVSVITSFTNKTGGSITVSARNVNSSTAETIGQMGVIAVFP